MVSRRGNTGARPSSDPRMKTIDPVRSAYRTISFLAVLAGMLGMLASAVFLGTGDLVDAAAGASGFLAGAVLVGSGLIAMSLLHLPSDAAPSTEP